MALTIKQWRRVKGITQEELATSLSVHPNTIAEWENNPKKIQIGWAYKSAERLESLLRMLFFCQKIPQICRGVH